MARRRTLPRFVAPGLLVAAACSRHGGPEPLKVTINVDPQAIAQCVELQASSAGAAPLLTGRMPRADTLEVAVYPGNGLAGDVTLTAFGYYGNGCADPQLINIQSDPVDAAFTTGQIGTVEVDLHPPSPLFDGDGDGYRRADAGGPDCDDAHATVYPGAPETCDGLDNNCNGQVDEGFALGIGCDAGLGVCAAVGTTVCSSDHARAVCSAVPNTANQGPEKCDGLDNDCNGIIDDGFNVGAACDAGLGVCARFGTIACAPGGATSQCSVTADASKASPEICDGLDNDCNGLVDEAPACGGPGTDVAENIATTWGAQEAGGTPCGTGANNATVAGTPSPPYCQVGNQAAMVTYTGGVYFMGFYPVGRNGAWDVSGRQGVHFIASGLVPPGYGGWAPVAPSLVLCNPDGGYLRFDAVANLLPFDGGSPVVFQIPLDGGAAWTLSNAGFDPRAVGWIQVEANPLQNGAPAGNSVLWVDDLRFY